MKDRSSVPELRGKSQNTIAIVINSVNYSRDFLSGTREELEEAVKEDIATAAAGNGYILCLGCHLPDLAPLENIRTYLKAAHQYGRYH